MIFQKTLSQNHRAVEVGMYLLSSSSPTTLLKLGQLPQVVQDCVQLGFEYLHRCKFHNLSEQLVPVFDQSHSKKLFSRVWKISCISVYAHHLISCQ